MSKKCNCCLSDLLILILIVLQFKPIRGPVGGPGGPRPEPDCPPLAIDNSILFLVALYYLACCKKC